MAKPCAYITGGAGFIGFHVAKHLLAKRWRVVVLDNCSRPGVSEHLALLKTYKGLEVVDGDIRRSEDIVRGFVLAGPRVDLVLHLAAHVGVSASIKNPRDDFEINLRGTFELLEAIRRRPKARRPRLFIFASTNKIYGDLSHYQIKSSETRHSYANGREGVAETEPLDFRFPYACSKGAADQYVRDYHRVYGLPTIVLRNSCIYGSHQYGVEDQSWLAQFAIRAYLGKSITMHGDGRQVRDLLYIDDFVRLIDLICENKRGLEGRVYNVGGGAENTVSLLELVALIEKRLKRKIQVKHAPPYPGDQKIFVSDLSSLKNELGWFPKVSVQTGLDRTLSWIETHLATIEKALGERPKLEAGKPNTGAKPRSRRRTKGKASKARR
ncbi:MAG: NAD-dependent epimerase/dehydratase family protein [Elusimicrobia bacterium]|nr:NAD-dependent epimerase/dehydratase family protein [Elusimicrobiota bacterium]